MPILDVQALFARRLQELARLRGSDLAAVARAAGIREARLQACVRGEASVELDELAALARALQVDPVALVREG